MMSSFPASRLLPFSSGVLGLCAVVLLYSTVYASNPWGSLGAATINFFSFFTVLSNLLVAGALLWPQHIRGAAMRGGIALYIVITGLIYFLLLRNAWNPTGAQWFANILLHYVMPPLYLFDWWRGAHGGLRWRQAVVWLGFPLGYALYTLGHGAVTGFYPYFFLDASKLGYGGVIGNIALLGVVFVALGCIIVAIDRARAKAQISG